MIIDVNVSLSRWPFRRTPCDEPDSLATRLQRHAVAEAWAGSLDGLFHRDVREVNRRLAAACRAETRVKLIPFGSINPTLPDWQEDLRCCVELHHMPGLRLHPNYHDYRLDDPAFAQALDAASQRGLIVQLAARMDDVRFQHPLWKVPDVDLAPLPALIKDRPKLKLVLLNACTSPPKLLTALAGTGRVWFDIATQEGVAGVAKLAQTVGQQRVLFGSHLPLFPVESALLKLRESGLPAAQLDAIQHTNAQRLLVPAP